MAKPSITTRTAKGTPLTIAEMDSNLTSLQDGQVKVAVPGSRTPFYPSGTYELSTEQKKFGDRSLKFNGSSNYVQMYYMSGTNPWDVSMSSFSAEQFIYIDSTGTGTRTIFDTRGSMPMSYNGLWVFINSSGYLVAKRDDTQIAISANPLATNTWHHVAIERYTYGGNMSYPSGLYLLVNGAVAGSWSDNSTSFDSNTQINYGRDKNSSNYFKGFMDEIRWSKSTNRYMPSMPMGSLSPAPTAELSSDYNTNYLFHCNDTSSLTDDYFTTISLDLNDSLKLQASNGIALSADTNNKQLTISYSNSNSPAGLIVKTNSLTNMNYNGSLNFSGSTAQYGSGIYTQSGGVFQIQNMSSTGGSVQYLIEVYGSATFTGLPGGTPNLELYNTSDMMTQSSETIVGSALPFLIATVNINASQSKNFVIRINGASGSESMTGSAILKVTKILT
jgi:hypothetical protein